jgi:hypothetical protein
VQDGEAELENPNTAIHGRRLVRRSVVITAMAGALIFVLASTPAMAQDTDAPISAASVVVSGNPFSPVSDPILSDPLYLPAKGKLYGTSAYSLSMPRSSDYNYLNVLKTIHHGHTSTVSQDLGYGLTTNITLRLGLSYDSTSNASTSGSTGTTSEGSSKGFNDPSVGIVYRALRQGRDHPVSVDFALGYAPDLIASKTGGNGVSGTAAAGRDSLSLSASVGRSMRLFTIQASFGATRFGTRSYSSQGNNHNFSQEGGWDYVLALRSQVRFSQRISLNAALAYSPSDHRHNADLTAHTAWTVQAPSTLALNTALNYHIIPNRLVGSFTFVHQNRGDSGSTFTNPTQNVVTRNAYANTVGIRLQYALN